MWECQLTLKILKDQSFFSFPKKSDYLRWIFSLNMNNVECPQLRIVLKDAVSLRCMRQEYNVVSDLPFFYQNILFPLQFL